MMDLTGNAFREKEAEAAAEAERARRKAEAEARWNVEYLRSKAGCILITQVVIRIYISYKIKDFDFILFQVRHIYCSFGGGSAEWNSGYPSVFREIHIQKVCIIFRESVFHKPREAKPRFIQRLISKPKLQKLLPFLPS